MTTSLQTWYDDLRTSLEDYGNTITDGHNGDGTSTIFKLTSPPIKTNSDTVTVGGVTQARGTNYTINYDNGEITFTAAPGNGTAVTEQYTSVIWRNERLFNATNSGIRALYPKVYQGPRFAYLQLRTEVYEYDLTSTVDVPDAASFADQTMPAVYVAASARADFLRAYTTILQGEFRPFGANQVFTPYEFFRHPVPTMLQMDMDPGPNDTLRLIYQSSYQLFTDANNSSATTNVPEEFVDLVTWYGLSVLMDKKEARRSRYDQYPAMQNLNAVPTGTQSQTAEDYLTRFQMELDHRAMKPLMRSSRRRLRPFQYDMKGY